MHVNIVFGFVVFATLYHFGYTCSCLPTTIRKMWCDADFVTKVEVTSTKQNPSGEQSFDDFYKVNRLGKPWKLAAGKKITRRRRVYTASNDAMCGVYLQKGQRYLLAGRVIGGKMTIDLCSSIIMKTPVPRSIKKYRKNPPSCSNRLFAPNMIKAPGRRK